MFIKDVAVNVLSRNVPYHRGSVISNRLGLQVARAVTKNVGWHLRPSRALSRDAETLVNDGMVVLPDFLSKEDFRRVRAEYEASRKILKYRWDLDYARRVRSEEYVDPSQAPDAPLVVQEELIIEDHLDALPVTVGLLRTNARLSELVGAAARRTVKAPPNMAVVIWRKREATEPQVRDSQRLPRGEYMLHADVHYPTFKAWLYLNDIDESNGAFVYVKGSHRMTLERLKYEYDASIRVARSKRDGRWRTTPYGHVRRISDEQLARMGLRETAVCAPANTLVLANTEGFHRRGEFLDGRPRETIFFNWRHLDTWMHLLQRPV